MASLTWWTWVWASSRSWWLKEKTGVLQSIESKTQTRLSEWTVWSHRVRHSSACYNREASDTILRSTRRPSFSSPLSFDYIIAAHTILRTEHACLSACISLKPSIIINLLHAYHFASCWICSALRNKEPEPQFIQIPGEWF